MAKARKRVETVKKPVPTFKSGRCGNCGSRAFSLSVQQRALCRKCKNCKEIFDLDKMIVIRQGVELINATAMEAPI